MAKHPKEPPHSCPRINAAIDEIEAARVIHADLRAWGLYWQEKYEKLERDHEREIERLHDRINNLEDAK